MALIEKTKKKRESGRAYSRLFGDESLGQLISRVHSAVISNGNELENIIKKKACSSQNLDEFLKQENRKGVFVFDKNQLSKSKIFETKRFNQRTQKSESIQPDFLVFKHGRCYVIELKDGDTFDTKKATGERANLEYFKQQNAGKINYKMDIFFCCFNQEDKERIKKGFKNKIDAREILTGREFCDLIEVDYEEILKLRKKNQKDNRKFFLSELSKVSSVKEQAKFHKL